MTKSPSSHYANAPLWEVGLSVKTDGLPFYDPLEIGFLHRRFRDQYPQYERQPTHHAPPAFNDISALAMTQNFVQLGGIDETRWWFVSEDGRNVVQLQDRFIARNWRRLEPAPSRFLDYPGFENLLEDYKSKIKSIVEWNSSQGRETPQPTLCDLLYDNLIPLFSSDGQAISLGDVFTGLIPDRPEPIAGLTYTWLEVIKEEGDSSHPNLQITAATVFLPSLTGDTPNGYLKLTLNGRTPVRSWTSAWQFFERAHAYIGKRLIDLTTPTCRATWRAQ